MRTFIAGLVIGMTLSGLVAEAALLNTPPPVADLSTYKYLKELQQNMYNLPVVTTNPNGSRVGRRGDMVMLDVSGTQYIEVCTSTGPGGGTKWRGVALSNVP